MAPTKMVFANVNDANDAVDLSSHKVEAGDKSSWTVSFVDEATGQRRNVEVDGSDAG